MMVTMNVIWFLLGGVWLAISHALFGVLFCITIIGIPFGIQHFKLAALSTPNCPKPVDYRLTTPS